MRMLNQVVGLLMSALLVWSPLAQPVAVYAETVQQVDGQLETSMQGEGESAADSSATAGDPSGETSGLPDDASDKDPGDVAAAAGDSASSVKPGPAARGAEEADAAASDEAVRSSAATAEQTVLASLSTDSSYDDFVKAAEKLDMPDPGDAHRGAANEPSPFGSSSPYWKTSGGVKSFYEADGDLYASPALKIIDVSEWQDNVDWAAVKKAGIDGAIIRLGFGYGNIDAKFERNVKELRRLGIPFGVYLYTYAYDADFAAKEGAWTAEVLDKYGTAGMEFPIFYDVENWTWTGHTRPSDPDVYEGIIDAYFDTLAARGYTNVSVTSYRAYLQKELNKPSIWARTSWIAAYTPSIGIENPYYKGQYGWQYTSSGRVAGVNGNVDISAFSSTEQLANELAAEHAGDLSDGTYTFASAKLPTSVLDAKGGGTVNGTRVNLYAANGTDAQVWRVSHDKKGYVTIASAKSGLVLDVKSGKSANGTAVQLYKANGSAAQRWIAVKRSDGSYELVSGVNPSKALDLPGGKTANGTLTQIYDRNGTQAQAWTASSAKTQAERADELAAAHASDLADGTYSLASSGKDETVLQSVSGFAKLAAISGKNTQEWKLAHDKEGYVTLTNVSSGLVLSVSGASTANKTKIVFEKAKSDSRSQRWIAVKNDDGTYTFVSALNGSSVLDCYGGSSSAGTVVQLYAGNGTAAQRWTAEDMAARRSELDKLAQENADVLKDGEYALVISGSGRKVVEVGGGKLDNYANVQTYQSNGTPAQRWTVSHDDKGYVTFTNKKSGRALDAYSGMAAVGTNIHQYGSNGTLAQKWIVKAGKDGKTLEIMSALLPKRYLTVKGGNVEIGSAPASIEAVSVQPEVEPGQDIIAADTWYDMAPASSPSKRVDVPSGKSTEGLALQLYAANQSFAQFFKFTFEDGYYRIESAVSGKVLAVSGGDFVPGGSIIQTARKQSDDSQLFRAVENGDGTVTFVNKASGLALDCSNGLKSAVVKGGSKAQAFALTPQHAFIKEGLYTVSPASKTSLALDVKSASDAEGAAVQLYTSNKTFAQKWFISAVDGRENTFTIEAANSAKRLTAAGSKVVLKSRTDDASQWWVPDIDQGGIVFRSAQNPSKALDVVSGRMSSGTAVQLYSRNGTAAQRFKLVTATATIPNGTYTIRTAKSTAQVLDVKSASMVNGGNVQVYGSNNTGAQKWKLTRNSDGSYTIVNANSGKALDLTSGNTANGTNVQQYTSNGSAAQRWFIEYVDGGYRIASAKDRSVVLDLAGGSVANGTNVRISSDNGSAGQRFTFRTTTYTPPVRYHHITWMMQPNNYYCGPTNGYMILKSVGASKSASGKKLTVWAVGDYMRTNKVGYTSFNDRAFATGMNNWLGKNVYTTIANPSYTTVKNQIKKSYENGYATAVDAHERRGGPHYNGHSNSTSSHIMAIDGYDEKNDRVYFVDSSSGWYSGAKPKFWHSLRSFVSNYLKPAAWRDGIGIYTAR